MPDPERIYLEPAPGDPDGRLWCKDDVWSGDPAYAQDGPPTAYVRADLHAALRAKVRALSAPLPSDPDGRMWSTLGYFANREGDDLDTEVMAWAMREITGLRTRVAELEAALRDIIETETDTGGVFTRRWTAAQHQECVVIARRALGDGHG